MVLDPIAFVLLVGVATLFAAGLRSLLMRGDQRRASTASDGVQEVEIIVRGRYRPDTVVLRCGVPVRMLFNRQEDVACSERVIFSDFQQERWLAPFATTAVQFTPTRSGEFLFTCAMGMYQGRLLVEGPRTVGGVGHLLRTPGLALHALNHGEPKAGRAVVPGQPEGGTADGEGRPAMRGG